MPRNKSITSIDNRIKKVQEDLFKTKARLDKLTAELRGLEREKKLRQADAILQALSKSGKSLDDVLTFFLNFPRKLHSSPMGTRETS